MLANKVYHEYWLSHRPILKKDENKKEKLSKSIDHKRPKHKAVKFAKISENVTILN